MTLKPAHRTPRAPRQDPQEVIRAFLRTIERIAVRARKSAAAETRAQA